MAIIKHNEGGLYLSDNWYVSDVHNAAENMGITITEEEAEEVLIAVADSFDANIGINWELFSYHLEDYRKEDDND